MPLAPRGSGYDRYERWIADEGELLVLFDKNNVAVDVLVIEPMQTPK
jgi:hypothetical protein